MAQYYAVTVRSAIVVGAAVQRPHSRGTLSLASADPLDRPLIDLKFLHDARDRHILKSGMFLSH